MDKNVIVRWQTICRIKKSANDNFLNCVNSLLEVKICKEICIQKLCSRQSVGISKLLS